MLNIVKFTVANGSDVLNTLELISQALVSSGILLDRSLQLVKLDSLLVDGGVGLVNPGLKRLRFHRLNTSS